MSPDRRSALAGFDPLARRMTLDDLTSAMLPDRDTTALQASPDGTIAIGHFRLTSVGLETVGNLTVDEWQAAGTFLDKAGAALQWWIGDWINAAPAEWGDTYTEAERLTNLKSKSLRNLAYVCRSVDLSLRKDNLSFSHHAVVAALSPEHQAFWLDQAVRGKLSVGKLKRMIEGREIEQPDPLLNRAHKRTFARLWKGIQTRQISATDVRRMREWLDALEASLGDNS